MSRGQTWGKQPTQDSSCDSFPETTMCDHDHRGLKADCIHTGLHRRSFLRGAAAGAAAMTMAVPSGLLSGVAHAASGKITATHGAGFCNLNLFLSHVLNTVGDEGVDLKLITTPTFADEVTMIAAGQIDVGIMPYTTFLAL